MTSRAIGAWALGAVLLTALPAQAQRRELQQMAADLRILQEQTQLLQNAVTALNESLKSVNARIDEQATVTRKGFADNKLVVDGMGSDIRVVRERVDDTNVRITSLSQEVEALRLAIPPMPVYSPPTDTAPGGVPGDPSSPAAPAAPPSNPTGAPAPAAPAPTPAAPAPGSPTRLYDMAWADYTAGSYDLAIEGFSSYVRSFPKSESADNAQYYIGDSYFQRGRWPEAVDAFDRVITTYPKGDVANQAYYQARTELRADEPDRPGAAVLRVRDQERSRHRRRPPGQTASRLAEPRSTAIASARRGAATRPAGPLPEDDDIMGSVNKVILVGNLGRDAELRATPSGASVANFSIATTENWTGKDGQKQEKTEWHRIVLWGKTADTLQPYLTKGKQIYLEGRLETRQWEKEGQKHYTTEIKADKVVLLGGGGRGGERGDRGEGGYNEPMGQPAAAITDDDIPF